jgi:AAA domain, putative AbiEii toxin, Type IV TA system
VDLKPLTFLVGPNGSGKSNFLDGIRFVADALRTSLDHALRDRGAIKEVRRRSGGHPSHFAIRLDFTLTSGAIGHYSFRIGAKPSGGFEVQNEECKLFFPGGVLNEAWFHVKSGQIVGSSAEVLPPVVSDRLFLVAASGLPEFRPVYDALSRMSFYNLNPRAIADMQKPDAGELLAREGWNSASVFEKLTESTKATIADYLGRIVSGIAGVDAKVLGSQETLEFRQIVKGQRHPWRFLASSMSDGTLRAFGILYWRYFKDRDAMEKLLRWSVWKSRRLRSTPPLREFCWPHCGQPVASHKLLLPATVRICWMTRIFLTSQF